MTLTACQSERRELLVDCQAMEGEERTMYTETGGRRIPSFDTAGPTELQEPRFRPVDLCLGPVDLDFLEGAS